MLEIEPLSNRVSASAWNTCDDTKRAIRFMKATELIVVERREAKITWIASP